MNMLTFEYQLNQIRDTLRKVGVTDSDSITHCIALMTLRRLDEKICKKTNVPVMYSFEKFENDEKGKLLDDEELRNKFWGKDENNFCWYLRNRLGFVNFKFKTEITNIAFRRLFEVLKSINTEEKEAYCDIVGSIYELHLKTGSKSSRDLGQFFTHRLVIKFMIEWAKPQLLKNGQIETIVDPTMGTAGFLTMSIDYINKEQEKKGKTVNWSKNKDRIFGYDLASNIRDLANINLLLETGENFTNILTRNTLEIGLCNNEGIPLTFDVILANEPMGIKGLKYADCCDSIKNLKISGTKAEPMFLQLMMASLNPGGRCAVIVPDGVLFQTSKQHIETRKYLVENFMVEEIVKMNDKNFFMNTGVNASIIFFKKPECLEEEDIKFSEISLNKKGDEIEYKFIKKVEYDEVIKNGCNLNIAMYTKKDIKCDDSCEVKTLGDVCDLQSGYAFKTKDFLFAKERDVVPLLKINNISDGVVLTNDKTVYVSQEEKLEKYAVKKNNFVIAMSGATSGKIGIYNTDEKMYLNQRVGKFVVKSSVIKDMYLFYYLRQQENIFLKMCSGTAQGNINPENILSLQIPIPPLEKQQEIIEKCDLLSETNRNCEKLIEQLKETFKIQMGLYVKECNDSKTLEELCDYKIGKFISKNCQNTGLYPFYSSKATNPVGFIDTFCFDYPEYLLLTKDGGSGAGKYGEQIGLGKIFKQKGKCGATSSQVALVLKDVNATKTDYVYYFLKTYQNKIIDMAQYTVGLGHVKIGNIMNIKIPLPSLEKQQEIINQCESLFSLISSLETRITDNKKMLTDLLRN